MEPAWTCTFSIINTTLGRQREEDSRREEKQRKMWEMQGHRTDGENKSSGRKLRIWAEGWVRRWTGTEREEKKRQGRQERSNWGQKQTDFSQYIHKGGGKAGVKREWQMRREKMCQEEECYMTRDAVGMHAMYPAPWREAECTKRTTREGGGRGGRDSDVSQMIMWLSSTWTNTHVQADLIFFFLQAKFRKVRCSSAKYITSKKLWTEGRKKRL